MPESPLLAECHVLSGDSSTSDSQLALLSLPLWRNLTASLTNVSSKLAISISISDAIPPKQTSLSSISCWATKDDTETEGSQIRLPSDLYQRLSITKQVRRKNATPQVFVRSHTPLTLSVVYLAVSFDAGFQLAQSSQDDILRALDTTMVRQGDSLRIDLSTSILPLRVVMTEPVLQGCFSGERTRILLTLDENQVEDSTSHVSSNFISNHTVSTNVTFDPLDDDSDSLSIDERFLAQTVLADFPSSSDIPQLSPHNIQQNGFNSKSMPSPMLATRASRECFIRELKQRYVVQDAIASWKEQSTFQPLAVSQKEPIDQENIVLLTERHLALLGAFNGDWAVAEIQGQDRPRIVRLFTSEQLPICESSPSLWISPQLLQNFYRPETYSPMTAAKNKIFVRPLGSQATPDPTGVAKSCPLPVPFADSLTIARVAGPFSVDRSYQGLFLEALRTYFDGKPRICREGDVIAVAIEAGKARFIRKQLEQESPTEAILEDIHELQFPSTIAPPKSAVIYFKITELKGELIAPQKITLSGSNNQDIGLLSLKCQSGSFGCVVDPEITKMVQTGVEKCQVADCSEWLGISSDTPERPSLSTLIPSPLTGPGCPFDTILGLLNATLHPNADRFGLHLSILLKGGRGCGKKTVVRWIAKTVGVQLIEIDCFDLVSDTDTRTEGILRARFEKAAECAPAILLLRNVDALARKSQALETGQEPAMVTVLQNCIQELKNSTKSPLPSNPDGKTNPPMPVAVFGTTGDPEKCPTGILGCFKHQVSFSVPNEAERLEMFEIILDRVARSPDVDVKNLATQTAALVAADLVNLVARAKLASVARVRKEMMTFGQEVTDQDLSLAGMVLTGSDFEQALNKARSSYSESIGAPKIPNVTWDDVGGLTSVKSDILDTIQLPLEHPELFSDGLKKRSGILLYGPPGTGKTLLAKAVATSCSLNFFSVKGPELLNMYIGESEANVRRVFQRARDAKPCVIFFDELDSVAPKRGNQGDSGGVMDRIVSQLLAELDGMAGSSQGTDVFVIGATNRPDLLDPALLRPGRFDRMLYLSVAETHQAQLNILEALTRKFQLDPEIADLSVIANQCPFNLTGADFYALCSDAMLKAMTRKASEIDSKIEQINQNGSTLLNDHSHPHPHPITAQYYLAEIASPQEIQVRVNRIDFESALHELVPSVSEQEMLHYQEVQAKFSQPKKEQKKPNNTMEERISDLASVQESLKMDDTKHQQQNVSKGSFISPSPPTTTTTSSSSMGKGKDQEMKEKFKNKGKARALE